MADRDERTRDKMKDKDLSRKHRGFQIIHEEDGSFTVLDLRPGQDVINHKWCIQDGIETLEEAKSVIDSYISGALVEY